MSLRRWAWAGIALALLAAAGLRAGLVVHRYFDTDELEHLHAGLLASAALAVSFLIPAVSAARLIRYGNELQRERWRCASDFLPNEAAVWDSWSGDAFHRPHAAFIWSVPVVGQFYDPAMLERQFVTALAAARTRGAIRCESCLERLPKGVTAAFNRYFEPSGCGRLWLRKRGG